MVNKKNEKKTEANREVVVKGLLGYDVEARLETRSSEYGTVQPSITIDPERVLRFRFARGVAHKIAAEIEFASESAHERWCVQLSLDERPRVYLELADATPEEAERGFKVLEEVLGRISRR